MGFFGDMLDSLNESWVASNDEEIRPYVNSLNSSSLNTLEFIALKDYQDSNHKYSRAEIQAARYLLVTKHQKSHNEFPNVMTSKNYRIEAPKRKIEKKIPFKGIEVPTFEEEIDINVEKAIECWKENKIKASSLLFEKALNNALNSTSFSDNGATLYYAAINNYYLLETTARVDRTFNQDSQMELFNELANYIDQFNREKQFEYQVKYLKELFKIARLHLKNYDLSLMLAENTITLLEKEHIINLYTWPESYYEDLTNCYENIGRLYKYEFKKLSQAEYYFNKALQTCDLLISSRDSPDVFDYIMKGDIYVFMENKNDAISMFELAIDISDDSEWRAIAQERINEMLN